MRVSTILLAPLSPTLAFAAWRKCKLPPYSRAQFIRRMNCIYLAAAIVLAAGTFIVWPADGSRPDWSRWWPALSPLAWYLASRCNEVFLAFYFDAFDKLRINQPPSSALAWPTRVRLALNSYGELILNFAVLYALLPADMWQPDPQRPHAFIDFLTYSALTITTSGGGGFVAKHWLPQLMTVYEVMCGLILLVVSFTIYTGRALAKHATVRMGGSRSPGA